MHTSEEIPRAWSGDGRIHVEAGGKSWILRRPASLEQLWGNMEADAFDEDHIPYWTELWPSSLGLACWLFSHADEIRSVQCLDLGCGLGFTAIVGQYLGARMIGLDSELAALRYCRLNAMDNGLSEQPAWLAMDWRAPALAPKTISRIWAADIIYEKRFITPVVNFLDFSLAENGVAWFAEPGRTIFDEFLETLNQRGWQASEVLKRELGSLYPQSVLIGVRVWEIYRKPH